METKEKPRIYSCDFIRGICAIGIIIYHISCRLDGSFRPLLVIGGTDGGIVLVTVFWVLSGAMLFYHHDQIASPGEFYYKRWKSLFPMFYIAYLSCFVTYVVPSQSVFYLGRPFSFILTVLGMDGYFQYLIPDYYILGEWFLGAIILLYILYPLLVKGFEKADKVMIAGSLLLCVLAAYGNMWKIEASRNLFSCLFCFVFGICVTKYKLSENKIFSFGAAILFVLLCIFCKGSGGEVVSALIRGNAVIYSYFLGFCMYFFLYRIGSFLAENPYVLQVVRMLSRQSYPVFLLQNVILSWVTQFYKPHDPLKVILLDGLIIIYVLLMSKCLSLVTDAVLNSKLYLKFEHVLLHRCFGRNKNHDRIFICSRRNVRRGSRQDSDTERRL